MRVGTLFDATIEGMESNLETLCPWCGVDRKENEKEPHQDWCPDNTGLRQETMGLPPYMRKK